MRKSVPEQVASLRKRSGLSLADLADKMGFKRASSIQRYESTTDFRGKYLSPNIVARMSEALVGLGDPPITDHEIRALGGPLLARTSGTLVPVISFVQAGGWTDMADAYPKGNGYAELTADTPVSPNAFALEIMGNSMQTRFQEGDRIIIDPGVEPIPGDFVVAKLDSEDQVTFKQYRPRGVDAKKKPIIELKPLNDHYPTITLDAQSPGRVIGTMVEHRSYRRT